MLVSSLDQENRSEVCKAMLCNGVSDIESLRGRRILVYGAGKIGERLYVALSEFGIEVERYWDEKASTIQSIGSCRVESPNYEAMTTEDRETVVVLIAIFAETISDMLRDRLIGKGFSRAISDRKFISSILKSECRAKVERGDYQFDLSKCHLCPVKMDSGGCEIFSESVEQVGSRNPRNCHEEEPFAIPSLGLILSSKCTLTCLGCNHLRDHFEPEHNVDLSSDDVLNDLKIVTNAVDFVRTVVLVGGEPFLYRNIERIIKGILEIKNVGVLHIITNGTVVSRSKALFQLLRNARVLVEVSGYGDRLPKQLHQNVKTFLGQLSANDVSHRYTQTMTWFEFGGFDDRGYTDVEVRQLYEKCCFKSHDIFDGKMFKCSRSAYGTFIGKIAEIREDYVDIRSPSHRGLKEDLRMFLEKDCVEACRYCNGSMTNTTIAGVQKKPYRDT